MAQQQREEAKQPDEAGSDEAGPDEPVQPGRAARREKARKSAAEAARAAMQRRHLRIGAVMTAATGFEVAGAVGLVGAGLLPWLWQSRLWGTTEAAGVTAQVAVALTVVTLVVGWLSRAERLAARIRVVPLVLAAALLVTGPVVLWQTELGGRGPGPLVAAVAALLVVTGTVGWLLGLRELRKLFPFGLAQARSQGYGNLAAVRRARLVGGPLGALVALALVAGTALVAPGWLTTADSRTAHPLSLSGAPPVIADGPDWELELPTTRDSRPPSVWALETGTVVEELTGVRGVDPTTGAERWHWRDEAYRRSAGALTDGGDTVVLAMTHVEDIPGRDKVVALDSATGELRWQRYDDDLVEAMALTTAAPPGQGDWFAAPVPGEAAQPQAGSPQAQGGAPPTEVLLLDSSDGGVRARLAAGDGCQYQYLFAEPTDVLVTGALCRGEQQGPQPCQLTGVAPADGSVRWTWPPEDVPALDCQLDQSRELLFARYLRDGEREAVALDPTTGEPVWQLTQDPEQETDELTGLTNPVPVGDAVLGSAQTPDGSGSMLIIREASDGTVRDEIDLPAGRAIAITAVGPQRALVNIYRPETSELVAVEVDPTTGELGQETPVAASPEGSAYQRLAVATGPGTLAVYTTVADGQQPGPDDYRMFVHGWSAG